MHPILSLTDITSAYLHQNFKHDEILNNVCHLLRRYSQHCGMNGVL